MKIIVNGHEMEWHEKKPMTVLALCAVLDLDPEITRVMAQPHMMRGMIRLDPAARYTVRHLTKYTTHTL